MSNTHPEQPFYAKLCWEIDLNSILVAEEDVLQSRTFSTNDGNFKWHLELNLSVLKSCKSLDFVSVWLYCDANVDLENYSHLSGLARTRIYSNNWFLLEAPKSHFKITFDGNTRRHRLISFNLRNIKQRKSKNNKLSFECGLHCIVKDAIATVSHESSHSRDLKPICINDCSDTRRTISSLIENEQCSVHNVLLATRLRTLFDAVFSNNTTQKQKNRIRETFVKILDDIYVGKMPNLEESAFEVLPIADKFNCTELKNICEEVLLDKLSAENAGRIFDLADKHDSVRLKTGVLFIEALCANGRVSSQTNERLFEHFFRE